MIDKGFNLGKIIESVNAIIWEYNIIEDSWDYVSPQTKTILGFEPEEWTGLDFWVENLHEEDKGWAKDYCLSATSRGENHIFEYRFMKKSGGYVWLRDEVVVIMEQGKPNKLRGFMTNITELKEREEKIKYISFHDELTGLYNRRFFEEQLNRLNHSKYFPLAIVMGDVNGLKLINDTFGHIVGDNYLKLAASIIKSKSREDYIVTRWGGDEFIILIPNSDSSAASKLITSVEEAIEEMEFKQGRLSIAFGYDIKTQDEQDIQEIFRTAEEMMYLNKKSSL
jgi:diguanylate cyclase (GGDEF)-like protein/PAS domain S-box-containing protein